MRVHEHTKAALALVEMRYQDQWVTVARITKMVPAVPTINEPGEGFCVRAARRRFEHGGSGSFTCRAVIFIETSSQSSDPIGPVGIVSVRRTTARDSTRRGKWSPDLSPAQNGRSKTRASPNGPPLAPTGNGSASVTW